MDETMNSIILIGNSTFTYSEDKSGKENNKIICQEAKSKYQNQGAEKQNYLPFNTITITSLGDSNKSNCQESMQQMEPVVFDNNFGQFGYFNQDYSNLTVYLNDTSLINNSNNGENAAVNHWSNGYNLQPNLAPDDIGNYPFFRNENAVDFPFINIENAPADTNPQIDEALPFFDITNNKIENDAPEYIDINSLVIPSEYQNYFPLENTKKCALVPPFLKRNRKGRTKANGASTSDDLQDDDDVIFVKEYKHEKAEVSVEKVVGCEPRRNPKRQVQMQKVSYDLALKMSLDGYYEDGRFGSRDYMSSARKSTRTNGAIYSPPNSLNNNDYKEWPVEGMHEKPNFNPITRKLEKFPNQPKRNKVAAQRPIKKRSPKKKSKKEDESVLTKSFASTTHKTIHSVLSYIEQIKEYNLIKEKNHNLDESSHQIEISADADKPDVIENEDGLFIKNNDTKEDNLLQAEDILVDSCILYCLANDVKESALAKYFNEVTGKENKFDFLNSILDDCETTTSTK